MQIDNVIIYPRKSREDLEREKETGEDSLALMTELLVKTCQRMGISSFDVLPEIGSADTIDGRPVFSDIMTNLIPSGKYQGIVVREISRLGRGNFADAGRIYEAIITHKFYIITTNRVYDPTNKADLRSLRMELFMAREEYEMTKERLWYGRDERAKQGYAGGYLPVLGLTSYRGKFSLVPDELEVLKRIFTMRAEENSCNVIADVLNSEGRLSKKGKKWDPTSIWQILRNKRYIGIAKWGGQEIPAKHPPLVDLDLWEAAQRVNKDKANPNNWVESPYIVRLHCHECGSRMYGSTDSAKTKINGTWKYYNKKPFYVCNGRRTNICSHRVRAEKVHDVIMGELRKMFIEENWKKLVDERNATRKKENLGYLIKEKEKALKVQESFLVKLDLDYKNGLKPALYSRHYEQTENAINTLKHEIRELEKRAKKRKATPPSNIKKQLLDLLDKWDSLTNKRKKEVIRAIFPRIELAKNGEYHIDIELPEKV
jgi:DNA invertase Pin-like site-specific DNA recombinase